jgi:TldD protein
MRVLLVATATLVYFSSWSQTVITADPLLTIVEEELTREMSSFSKASQPPYYLAYRISDLYSGHVQSSFGSLVSSYTDHNRIVATDCKVGDYTFDDSHPVTSNRFGYPGGYGPRRGGNELPLDDHPQAIKTELWEQTQDAYRAALASYKTVRDTQTTAEKSVNDFSKEEPLVSVDPPLINIKSFFDQNEWEKRIRKYSKPFLQNTNIVDADASLEVGTERKYFASSEGARIVQNRTHARLYINASILAEDGDILPMHLSYFAFDPGGLPSDEQVLRDVQEMISKLEKLRTAPIAEPYSGPAILHARAAGVFFHEIFGHRIEGHRLKDELDGQTFKTRVEDLVLPKSLSIVSDPTLSTYKGRPLNGHYRFDDEGVKGRRVSVVENGVLQNFLMSRTPIENFASSNGHGRAEPGMEVVSRQSNLIVESKKPVEMKDLRKMLINECKKQKRDYGYLFMDVVGGFTTTQRFMPNAFNIFPTEVYRIYTDGRPDELVRGVDLIGTPLAMFAEITAADGNAEVFTGFCGAESGSVPVTAVSPSLYVKRIETQKKITSHVEKPLLEKPVPSATGTVAND